MINRETMREHNREFWAFHKANPHVYRRFIHYALEAVRVRGRKHFSARAIVQLMRWDPSLKTDGEPFKICNNHVARYARLAVSLNPSLAGVFTMREDIDIWDTGEDPPQGRLFS